MGKVLVVDDDGALRRLARLVLEQEGHTVVEAQDGRFAMDALTKQGPFDVILLDLVMPWVDGFEMLKSLAWLQTKVVVLTARDDAYSEARVDRVHPVFRYLTKPVEGDELASVVRDAIGAPPAPH